MNIRAATKADAKLLADIHRECFPNYWNIDAFNDFFAVKGTFALLVDDVGMVVYRMQHEQADIITVAVLPGHRRKGIARQLVERAMAHLAQLGAEQLFLDVEDGNVAALKLYKSQGFSQIRRRKLYYRQKDGSFTDALVMGRKLGL